jgi:hypothetical protein
MTARLRTLIVAASWPVLVALALWARARSPIDPSGSGRGQNWAGDLEQVAVVGAVEVIVLLAILRPWSYRRSWGRAFGAAVLYGLYGLLSFVAGMHSGSIVGMHELWLLAIAATMVVSALVSLLAPEPDAAA